MAAPLECPVLVGRDDVLADLVTTISDAESPHTPVMVVRGEAGIGKSRLVSTALAVLRERGIVAVTAGCVEPDRVTPYALVADVLGDAETVHRLAASTAATRSLSAAVVAHAERAAEDRPAVIVFEDIQWADEASLEVIRLVGRAASAHRVTLI